MNLGLAKDPTSEHVAVTSAMQEPHGIHFMLAVWGKRYVDMLLDVTLPSQVTSGNLAGLKQPQRAVYRIFTTPEDANRIEAAPVVHQIAAYVPVDIQRMSSETTGGKHDLVASMQRRATRDAKRVGAGIAFLSPDIVVADGSFVALERLAYAGKTAIMIAAPRLYKPTFVPELLGRYRDPRTGVIPILPRDLVALSLRHLHPVSKALFWNRRWFSNWPSILYWHLGPSAMLARYWHMHPLYVRADRLAHDFSERAQSTIDGDLLMCMESQPETIHVVTDSDEILIYELSDDSMDTGLPGRKPWTTIMDLTEFAARATNVMHHHFVRERVFFHSAGRTEAKRYSAIIAESDALVNDILVRVRSGQRKIYNEALALVWQAVHAVAWKTYAAMRQQLR